MEKNHPEAKSLVNATEACAILGRSPQQVARYAEQGVLTVVYKGPGLRGARIFRRDEVEALAAKTTRTGRLMKQSA